MRFEVVQRGQIERVFTKNVIYLHKDGWNDWFKYETMFYLSYSDEKGNTVELGSIKFRIELHPCAFESGGDELCTVPNALNKFIRFGQ